jgi:hypothetical protein
MINEGRKIRDDLVDLISACGNLVIEKFHVVGAF